MTRLELTQTNITQAGTYWLVQASRPLLEYLDLPYNQLDAKAMQHMATGIWPNLQELHLAGSQCGRGDTWYGVIGLSLDALLLLGRLSKSTIMLYFWG